MPDAMDRMQAFNDDHVADALNVHADRERLAGREQCANLDCCAAISALRQREGAQLCVPCLQVEEAQSVHLRCWRGR